MISFRKMADGSWGVSGPPAAIVVGDVVAQSKDGELRTVRIVKVSAIKTAADGARYRYGYLEPVILKPEKLIANMSELSKSITRAANTLNATATRLTNLEKKLNKLIAEYENAVSSPSR